MTFPFRSFADRLARRLPSAGDLVPALVALWAVSLIVREHLPYLGRPYEQNIDEGYLLAVAQRMLHGDMLPLVDGVAHTGPLFLWSGALIASFGEFSWLPIRIAAVVSFSMMALLIYLVGRQADRPLAGAIGAAACPVIAIRYEALDGIAYNAEVPAVLFALASLLFALRAIGPRLSPRAAALAGLFAGCAALSKQAGALLIVPIGLLVLVGTLTRSDVTRNERVRVLAWAAGMVALPIALVVARYALAGALHDLRYYVLTYNSRVYMYPMRKVSAIERAFSEFGPRSTEFGLVVGVIAWALGQPLLARRDAGTWREAHRRAAFPLTLALIAIASIIGARASLRGFDHYQLLVVPWIALLIGSIVETASASATGARASSFTTAYRALLSLALATSLELSWASKSVYLEGWSGQHLGPVDLDTAIIEPPACALVREHSRPDQRLFVWGFRPELYVTCARLPASRFVFTTFVAGFVPWHGELTLKQEDRLSVRGSRDLLIRELEQTKPPVLIDAPRSMGGRSMKRYAKLKDYLDAHYHSIAIIDDDEIFVRNAESDPDSLRADGRTSQ